MTVDRGCPLWLRRVMFGLCVLVWIGAWVVTHTPEGDLPHPDWGDSALHGVGYAVLAGALWSTLWAYGLPGWRRAVWTLLAMLVYAAADEITQPFSGRTASLSDWAADVGGTLVSLAILEALAWVRSR